MFGESVSAIMPGTKTKKGFSFTIDSLISCKIDDHPIKTNFNAVILPEVSPDYSRSNMSSSSLDLKYGRTDEEFSEYSDTSDRMSPILAPQSCNTTSEFDREVQGLTVRSSAPKSDKSVIPRPSLQLHYEHSPQKAVTRHKKKARTAFTNEQLDQLEKRFQSQRYLAGNDRSDLAEELKLTDQQVKTWFQNRRMKKKRQQKLEQTSMLPFPTGGVDVRQLHALGIPCPILPVPMTIPSYQRPVFPSQINSPHVPPSSRTVSGIMQHSPYYGHQHGFSQLLIKHIGPRYQAL